MREFLLPALRTALVTLVICGLIYPLALTGIAQTLFPFEANGSLLRDAAGTVVGSALIGQQWQGPEWFHGRPSATADEPYNAANSGGSNLGPTSAALHERLAAARTALDAEQPTLAGKLLPSDMLTASGSGLDPDITPANAALQVPRVARARGAPEAAIRALLQRHVAPRLFGVFGESRVNVLRLNLALDREFPRR